MIEVTVAYPAGQGRTFNMDYYLKTHIPLFQKRMGAAMKTIRVSRGIGGSTPRSPAAFVVRGAHRSPDLAWPGMRIKRTIDIAWKVEAMAKDQSIDPKRTVSLSVV